MSSSRLLIVSEVFQRGMNVPPQVDQFQNKALGIWTLQCRIKGGGESRRNAVELEEREGGL
jgi:hypothetical protein